MNALTEIPSSARSRVAGLFSSHRRQRAVIDAVFDYPFGRVYADSETRPEVAMLRLGTFALFGGDPTHPAVPGMLETLTRGPIVPETEDWSEAIEAVLGDRADRADRWGFSRDQLDLTHLRSLTTRVADGYEIHALHENEQLAREIEKVPGATAYESSAHYHEHCVGFCSIQDGKTNGIAVSYINARNAIEIQISINRAHQRKGLGTAIGASLLVYCLEQDIEPHWNAANEQSALLAQKLGYVRNDHYQPFRLH